MYLLQAKIGNNSQIVEFFSEKMNSKPHFLSFMTAWISKTAAARPMPTDMSVDHYTFKVYCELHKALEGLIEK